MNTEIYQISIVAAQISTVILFCISIFLCFKDSKPIYIKIFPIYISVAIVSEIAVRFNPNYLDAIFNIFSFVELAYFTLVFIGFGGKRWRSILIGLNGLFVAFCVYEFYKRHTLNFSSDTTSNFESVILMLISVSYFIKIFRAEPSFVLEREPRFWFALAGFFSSVISIPIILVSSYYSYSGNPDMAKIFSSIPNFAQIISYILLVKAISIKCNVQFS